MRVSRVFVLLLLSVSVLGISVIIVWKGYQQHRVKEEISQEVRDLQEEARRLELETQQLNNRIAYLQTSQYAEREVKKKLNLKKSEESVVVVQPDRFQKQSEDKESEELLKQGVYVVSNGRKSNLIEWWNFFFAPK